jgi:hypothetical protein
VAAAAVAAICRRLDGLPLALELAAARTRVLSPVQIADRLDDAFSVLGSGHVGVERHRTLEAALRWSYDLLDEPERALLARCSVFLGGFTLDAAEAVAAGLDGPVLDLVSSLVDKSLVAAGPGPAATVRYRLLEVVRQFAARTLRERGDEEEVRRRHRDHFAATAKSALPVVSLWSEDFLRLAPELDNVRAAVRWSLERSEAVAAAELVAAYPCWMPLGLLSEAIGLLQRAIDRAEPATVEPTALSAALAAASSYAVWAGRVDLARLLLERLGGLVSPEGSSSIVRARWLTCRANWAWIAADGDLHSIESLALASVREYEAAGLAYPWPRVLRVWAGLLLDVDDDAWWDLTMGQELPRVQASTMPRQANVILLMEQGHRAAHGGAVGLDECDRLLAEFGPPGIDAEANPAVHGHGLVHELVGDRRRAMADYRQHVWWCQQVGVLGHLPLSLRGTVRVLATAASERAATIHGAYEAVTASHGLKREVPFLDRLDAPALAACRAALGDDAFERARAKGHGMGAAEAASTALAALDAAIG